MSTAVDGHDGENHRVIRTVSLAVNRATAPAVILPTPDAVTYDPETTLADVPLTGGWAWVTDTVVPTVENEGYGAAMSVDDVNYDYTGVEGYYAQAHMVIRTVALTVNKAMPTVTAPKAKRLVYTGLAQVLVNAGSATGGKMQYAIGAESEVPEAFDADIPSATEVDTYTVWYRVVGDANHLDLPAESIEVIISEREFGTPDFTMPEQLTEIGESAFEGMVAMQAVDAHGCATVGKDAFRDTGLIRIRLPKDCDIDPEAFGDRRIYVFAPAGGATQSYCAERDNLVFIAE